MKTFFVWLGSGRSKKWDVGAKIKLLDQAAQARLPVPAGAVLLDEFFQLGLAAGVIVAEDNSAVQVVPEPQWLAETLFESIRLPRMNKPVAVRTAVPLTGYVPQLAVNFNDPTQLSQSLCKIWSLATQAKARRDALIMEMVTGVESGTAVSQHITKTDRIQTKTEFLQLPQLRAWQRPHKDLPPPIQRLLKLLRGVRRTFGAGDWVIDWADDGRICWLLQVQKLD